MSFTNLLKESKTTVVTEADLDSKIKKEAKNIRLILKSKDDTYITSTNIKLVVSNTLKLTSIDDEAEFKTTEYKQALNWMKQAQKSLHEAEIQNAETILRKNNFKIKSVHGTKFGTEFIFAKTYDQEDVEKILKGFTLKFDGKSVFVIG